MLRFHFSWLLAAAVLGGCGALPSTPAAPREAAAVVAAGQRDPLAAIERAAGAGRDLLERGLDEVLAAQQPAEAQRVIGRLFAKGVGLCLPSLSLSVDEALGKQELARLAGETGTPFTQPRVLAYVNGVLDRLVRAADTRPFHLTIVQAPSREAYNAGGHHLLLTTGMLRSLEDEAELASTLAHEIAHGLERHAPSGRLNGQFVLALVEAHDRRAGLTSASLEAIARLVATLPAEQQAEPEVVLPFLRGKVEEAGIAHCRLAFNAYFAVLARSRDNEYAADAAGVRLMARAGYDPRAMASKLRRRIATEAPETPHGTHPGAAARADAVAHQLAVEGLSGRERGAAAFQTILGLVP